MTDWARLGESLGEMLQLDVRSSEWVDEILCERLYERSVQQVGQRLCEGSGLVKCWVRDRF